MCVVLLSGLHITYSTTVPAKRRGGRVGQQDTQTLSTLRTATTRMRVYCHRFRVSGTWMDSSGTQPSARPLPNACHIDIGTHPFAFDTQHSPDYFHVPALVHRRERSSSHGRRFEALCSTSSCNIVPRPIPKSKHATACSRPFLSRPRRICASRTGSFERNGRTSQLATARRARHDGAKWCLG